MPSLVRDAAFAAMASVCLLSVAQASNRPGSAGTVLSAKPNFPILSPAQTDADGAAIRDRLKDMRGSPASAWGGVSDLRTREMASEAMSYGMRSAVAWRYGQIEDLLRQYTPQVDIIFNFAPLLIDEVGLPPVLSEYRDGYRLESDDLASSTQVAYRIEHGARLVSATPTWRNFLLKGYPAPEDPHPAILPKTKEEIEVWEHGVEAGWAKGLIQADRIFEANLAVLSSTLRGVLLYHRLVREGLMSPLHVARTPAGIKLEGKDLDIGRVIYRVPEQPGFRGPDQWRPMREALTP